MRKASLDLALQCERLFANGTAICEGTEMTKLVNRVRGTASPAVEALMRVAYPRHRGIPPSQTEFFKLVDFENNVWMGAVVDRTMLIYFDKEMANSRMDLKAGLVAVMDLASELLECERVVICIDRTIMKLHNLVNTFYWVGFELVKCPVDFNGGQLSDAWIAMEIEV
ncbi:ornithine decarboxylase antizyme-domain-containing protein [Myxozyma melibiosi]|uniref:Ornithine decarboxylase antizyme n=1 Tax=Myxozyma melibiosi TaxID=54550 RepID=A0ABR1FBF2_9ASCO